MFFSGIKTKFGAGAFAKEGILEGCLHFYFFNFCWFLIIADPKKFFDPNLVFFVCILRVERFRNFELYFCLDIKMNLSS